MTDRAEARRLILQLERDVLARTQIRALLVTADLAIAGRRQDLRNLKARIARHASAPGRRI
jgi:hypothetical protein